MTSLVSEDTISAFHSDGAVVLQNAVSADWLENIANAIDRDIKDPGPFVHGYPAAGGRGLFHGNLRTWERDPELKKLLPKFSTTQNSCAILTQQNNKSFL